LASQLLSIEEVRDCSCQWLIWKIVGGLIPWGKWVKGISSKACWQVKGRIGAAVYNIVYKHSNNKVSVDLSLTSLAAI
jgi:hypothetical protein